MNPADFLQKLLVSNPPVAKLVYAGLAVIAAASLAVTWKGFGPNTLYVGFYILLFAFGATMIAYVVSNERMRSVLGWALTVTFCLYLAGLPVSAMGKLNLPPPKCYLELKWDPQSCNDLFPTVKLGQSNPVPSPAVFRPTALPALLWRVDDEVSSRHPYTAGPIFLQFRDGVPRDQMIALAQRLTADGWPVAGADQGGQAVSNAPGDNEIRFFDAATQSPAIQLARKLNDERPAAPFVVRDFSTSGLLASPGQLEIWLAR